MEFDLVVVASDGRLLVDDIHWTCPGASTYEDVYSLHLESANGLEYPYPAPPCLSGQGSPPTTDWTQVSYPFDCGSVGYTVQQVAYVTLDVPSTLVLVRCNAGAGSPPSGLYLFDPGASGDPSLRAALLKETDGYLARSFTLTGTNVTMAVDGYSSSSVPRCCPDIHKTLSWSWDGREFAAR
jgi:hypothetical protein